MRRILTNPQLDKLSDLSLGLGQMAFGSTVLPYALPSIDKPSIMVLALGVVISIILWVFSIWIVRGKK